MSIFAFYVPLCTALFTLCGIAYSALALWGARQFLTETRRTRERCEGEAVTGVSVLKPLRGLDPRQYAGFACHCRQQYEGPFELLFGVTTLEDPAVEAVARLRVEFPEVTIRLVACGERLGANGKISSLVQMLAEARYEHVVINDSDITVSPTYLREVMRPFLALQMGERPVGLVTAPYFGQAENTVWSRVEALGVATEFIPGVLAARALEGGLRFGLGSTLGTTRTALAAIGGIEVLLPELADDYELGARLYRAGYAVQLAPEVVATNIPGYDWEGFVQHQLRWARSTRDSRRAGYLGLVFTFVLPWALATVLASGFALWSFTLLSLALVVRLLVALLIGVSLLRDGQVLRDLPLLPLRDVVGAGLWAWSYASDVVVWRGERFRLRRGTMVQL